MKRFPIIEIVLFSIVLLLDQLSKIIIANQLSLGQSVSVIPGILKFTMTYNRGTIWGIGQGGNFIFAIIAIVVVIIILVFAPQLATSLGSKIAIGAILGGAVGNLIDRFARGFVIDFIEFGFVKFPVFNVADMGIVLGAITLAIFMLFASKK